LTGQRTRMTPTYRLLDSNGRVYAIHAPEHSKLTPWDQLELRRFLSAGRDIAPHHWSHTEPWR